jgi:hypothetical protein
MKTDISAKSAVCIIKEEFYLEEVESRCFKNRLASLSTKPHSFISSNTQVSTTSLATKKKIVSVQPVLSVLGNCVPLDRNQSN